jgi:hypothetical protein
MFETLVSNEMTMNLGEQVPKILIADKAHLGILKGYGGGAGI